MLERLAFLISVGLVFHAVYSFSLFDIYFRSPLVHGMAPVRSQLEPPAKRLFLLVGTWLQFETNWSWCVSPHSKSGWFACG